MSAPDYALPPRALDGMRNLARVYVSRDSRAIAHGLVEGRVEKIVFAAIQDANPEATSAEISTLMELPPDQVMEFRDYERLKLWWPTDLVAQLAGMAAPRRARLVALFRGTSSTIPALYGRRAQAQTDLFSREARA